MYAVEFVEKLESWLNERFIGESRLDWLHRKAAELPKILACYEE